MVGHPCIPHPFAALQVYCYTFSLDLHVLGAPPAFVLSQDQTLKKVCIQIGPEGHLFNTPYLCSLLALFSCQRTVSRSPREPRTLLREQNTVKNENYRT